MRQMHAPTGNGEVLADPEFDAVAELVENNRRRLDRTDVMIGGQSLRELRAHARRDVLHLAGVRPNEPDAPLLLAGHQPELSHPGVWVKNFALAGLARKLNGFSLNLIVDNDTLKNASLRFPVWDNSNAASAHLESLPFDSLAGEEPYESRRVIDAELFRTFPERARPLWANWGFEPLLAKAWRDAPSVAEAFTAMRKRHECEWGCRNAEVSVSRLSQTESFRRFASHIQADLPRFRGVYNAAIHAYRHANGVRSANHPAPDLAEKESPFWAVTSPGRRVRATATSDPANLRPRALTLTLFARVCLGDFFIHGIGGGKYDEVTDAIIRDYFGVDPPAYQVLSATLHLPLPGFPSTADDLKRAERLVRDVQWNPQRHLPPGTVSEWVERKATLARAEPSRDQHTARREWFRELKHATEELRPSVANTLAAAESQYERVRTEVAANAVLQRRDFAWVLYPEATLRPFLQRFLQL